MANVRPTHFDPALIHSLSNHRRVDAFLETCAVLTAYGLIDLDDGGTVQQQYLDVTHYFKRGWSALQDELPNLKDIISLWMLYPHWERCQHLTQVVDLAFGIAVTSAYRTDFVDDFHTALDSDILAPSLHIVRSWFRTECVLNPGISY